MRPKAAATPAATTPEPIFAAIVGTPPVRELVVTALATLEVALPAAPPAALVAEETAEEEVVATDGTTLFGSNLPQLAVRSSVHPSCPTLFPTLLAMQSS